MKKQILVSILVMTILLSICSILAQDNPLTIIKQIPGYGDVTITIKNYNPSLLQQIFGKSFDNLFSLYFGESSIQVGEQADITGTIIKLGGTCEVSTWKLYIVNDGVATSLGDFNNDYNDYGSCNLEVTAAWTTTQTGTYSLKQTYQWSSSSTIYTENGDNTLEVTEATGTCHWTDWMTYQTISNGIIQYKKYSGTGNCNEDNQYRTNCNSGYYCYGTSNQLCGGASVCVVNTQCTPSWVCGDWSTCYGGTQTRTCSDSNNCGKLDGRPDVQKTCNVGLTECEQSGGRCVGILGDCNSGESSSPLDCNAGDIGLHFCCKPNSTNCDSNQELCDGVCSAIGTCGTHTGNANSITLNEFYSTSDEDFSSSVSLCTSNSQCPSVEGYSVSCDTSSSAIKRIKNRIGQIALADCKNSGSIANLGFFIRNFLFGGDVCKDWASSSKDKWVSDHIASGTGVCLAKSNSWYGKLWGQLLDIVGGFGLPAQYVMIISVVLIILVLMLILNMFK